MNERSAHAHEWLNDDALSNVDQLSDYGRANFVEYVIEILNAMSKESVSSVIGLVGSWGSGKSSVLDALARELTTPTLNSTMRLSTEWTVARLNPWLYEDARSLHGGFFSELRDALPEDEQWSEARQKISAIGDKLKPAAHLLQIVGVDGNALVESAQQAIKESETALRSRVEQILEQNKRPIVMLIDDLDRLSSDELMLVFKLVRLVGRLPHVYYVLSYDEQTLVDLIEKTDLVGSRAEGRALDYLEKIVQIRIDLPSLRPYEVDKFVAEAMQIVVSEHKLSVTQEELRRIDTLFDDFLDEKLTTPRALKRYFRQVNYSLSRLGNEVNLSDFLVITWIRTFEPGVYRTLQEERSRLLGDRRGGLRFDPFDGMDGVEFAKEWERTLERSGVAPARTRKVAKLLEEIFPALKKRSESTEADKYHLQSARVSSPGRVSNKDYFDRYFTFIVTEDDISDSEIRAALQELRDDGIAGPNLVRAQDVYQEEPELVIRKIQDALEAGHKGGAPLVLWLQDRHEGLDIGDFKAARLEALASQVICSMEDTSITSLGTQLSPKRAGLYFLAMIHHVLGSTHPRFEEEEGRRAEVRGRLEGLIRNPLAATFARSSAQHRNPSGMSRVESSLFFLWSYIDEDACRAAVNVEVHTGNWEPLDVVGWLIIAGELIGPFDNLKRAEAFLDLDEVAVAHKGEIDRASDPDEFRNVVATAENRREYAAALLKLRCSEQHRVSDH